MRISDWSSDVCSSDLQAFTAETLTWPGYGTAAENRLSCDPLGCLYRAGERRVAVLLDPRAAADDCAIAEVVVSQEPLRRQPCREPERVIDRFDVWREGAHAVWLDPAGIRVETVARQQGRSEEPTPELQSLMRLS